MTAPATTAGDGTDSDATESASRWERALLGTVTAAVATLVRGNGIGGWRSGMRLRHQLRAVSVPAARTTINATRARIETASRAAADKATQDLRQLGVATVPLFGSASTGPVGEALDALRVAALNAEASAEKVYQQVAAAVAVQAAAPEAARLTVAQRVLTDLTRHGLAAVTDRGGRAWSLPAYTQMLGRTLAVRAAVDSYGGVLTASGQDLVVVAASGHPCRLCAPWEGRVLSVSGVSLDYPSVGDARAAGLWHPNCGHALTAWTPGQPAPAPAAPAVKAMPVSVAPMLRQAQRAQVTALTPQAKSDADRKTAALAALARQQADAEQAPPTAAGGGGGRPPTPPPPAGPAPAGDAEPPRYPIPDLSGLPDIRDLLDTDNPDNAELLEALRPLETRFGPYRLQLQHAEYYVNDDSAWDGDDDSDSSPEVTGFEFKALIIDDAVGTVGTVERIVDYDGDYKIVVHNEYMGLDEAARGQGFAPVFGPALEGWYRRSGVDRIVILASMADGGYVWAKAGFDFDPYPRFLQSSIAMIHDHYLDNVEQDLSAADREIVEAMLDRFNGSIVDYPTPRELADLEGVDNKKLGKTLMRGAGWYGVKKLRP